MPDSLKLKVDEMVRAHRARESNDPILPPGEKARSEPVRSGMRGMPVWLAAACVAGAFACGLFVRLGPLTNGGAQMAANAEVSPWVAAAVGYQKLYTRDTVSYVQQDPAAAANIVRDIRSEDRLALRVPDLTSAGLTFKSVQRLRFNNKPLVQIVYLPQNGPPIALCVMKDSKPDQPVAAKTVDAMVNVEPYNAMAEADGIGTILMDMAGVDPIPVFMAATPDFVQKQPQAVVAYLKAWLDVAHDFKQNPKKVADVIYSFYSSKVYQMSADTFAKALGRVQVDPGFPKDLEPYLSHHAKILLAEKHISSIPD